MGLISLIFFALSKFLLLLIHSIKYFLIDSCGKLAVLSASPALSRFLGRFLIVLYFYLLLWMHSTLILGRMNNMHNIRVKTWLQENWGGPQASSIPITCHAHLRLTFTAKLAAQLAQEKFQGISSGPTWYVPPPCTAAAAAMMTYLAWLGNFLDVFFAVIKTPFQ